MTWQRDLTPCDAFGVEFAPILRAVGCLERGHPYPTGDVDPRVDDRLVEFAASPWQPAVAMGFHSCGLCLYRGEAQGRNNLFIPGDGLILVCPELVTHDMNAHGHAPPAVFCRAVLACPPKRSMDDLRSILANGGRPPTHPMKGG